MNGAAMENYSNGTRVEFFDHDGQTRRGRIVGRMSTRAESGKEMLCGYLIRVGDGRAPYFAEHEVIFPLDAVTDRPQVH